MILELGRIDGFYLGVTTSTCGHTEFNIDRSGLWVRIPYGKSRYLDIETYWCRPRR